MRTRGGTLQNRGTSFRIAYYDLNHIRQYESFTTEDEARRELANRIADVGKGLPVSSKPNLITFGEPTVTFGELAVDVYNDYKINKRKSIDDLEARFRLHIIPVLGPRKAAQITAAHLNAYIVHRKSQKPTPSDGTINRELEAIRHAFKMGLYGGRILRMPKVPHLKESNTRSGFLTRAEVDRLTAAMKEPYRSFTMFGFLTGWRYSEIQGLQWRNVDFLAGEIRLDAGTTKSGAGRVFVMTDELRGLLRALDKKRRAATKTPDPAVKGVKPMQFKGMTAAANAHVFNVGQFRKTWKTACHAAGLPCVVVPVRKGGKRGAVKVVSAKHTFHDLRRSAAKALIASGIPERVVMEMCGWKTRSVFDRYHVVGIADLKMAADRINGARNGATGTRDTGSDQ